MKQQIFMSVLLMLQGVFDVRVSNLYERGQRNVVIVLRDEQIDRDGNLVEKSDERK